MKLDLTKVPKLKPATIFKGLPQRLKDPKVYEDVENKLKGLLKTDHQHKNMSSYVKCEPCQARFNERKRILREIGFKSIMQYLEWKKIMVIITQQKNFKLR